MSKQNRTEAGVLRLLAEDSESLGIIAAACQDALVRPGDLAFDRKSRTFGIEMNRFQWERAGRRPPFFRSRAVLAFSGVLAARSRNLPRGVDDMLSVLDLAFTPAQDPPAGTLRIILAGEAGVELDLECLDATLMDTGVAWPTRRKPNHEARS